MRPANTFLQETLNSMVNETFDRCMKNALRFPDYKRKLNSIANEAALFQKTIMTEMSGRTVSDEKDKSEYFEDVQNRIRKKQSEIDIKMKTVLPKL